MCLVFSEFQSYITLPVMSNMAHGCACVVAPQ